MMSMLFSKLAQADDPTVVTSSPIWQVLLENALGLAILFIFLTALVTVIVSQRRRDKCLKLFDGFHVSYLTQSGKAMWGDLVVFSKGLEIIYDAPYMTRRGIYKTSSLLYETDTAQSLAICRMIDSLDPGQKHRRLRQISKTFRPNLIRRTIRRIRNIINMLRDAFSKALSTLIGAWAQTSKSTVVTSQKAGIEQIGQTLLGVAGNAYEPLLERHIGKPVVLQMQTPASDDKIPIDVPGYLADYSETHIAVFNVEHEPISQQTMNVSENTSGPGYDIQWQSNSIVVRCVGPEALVVRSLRTRSRFSVLDVVLTHGVKVALPNDGDVQVELELERTRRFDVVCPRSQAIVYFGGRHLDDKLNDSSPPASSQTSDKAHGVAPETQVEAESDSSVDRDLK